MSGGYFDYYQFRIKSIINSIEELIERNGRAKTHEELTNGYSFVGDTNYKEYYEKYPEEKFWHKYSDEVIEEFKIAVEFLRTAYVYAQRIDWLVSNDDDEDSFLKRLEEELLKIK